MDIHLETDEQIWLSIVPGALCKWDPTMEMIRGPDDEIYLRTTRDIMPREELRAWFSPSLERELGISKRDIDMKTNGMSRIIHFYIHLFQKGLWKTLGHSKTELHYGNSLNVVVDAIYQSLLV